MELARLSARRRIMDSIRTTNLDSHGGFELGYSKSIDFITSPHITSQNKNLPHYKL
jgi:hypothetical protein